MPQTLTMDPDANVEAVVRANAHDYGEEDWEILQVVHENNLLYVKVLWESERKSVAYVRIRDEMSHHDAETLRDQIETASFRINETEAGNWSVYRDMSFRGPPG